MFDYFSTNMMMDMRGSKQETAVKDKLQAVHSSIMGGVSQQNTISQSQSKAKRSVFKRHQLMDSRQNTIFGDMTLT